MKGTTRNTDPFYIGISDLNDKNTEAALRKIFSRPEYKEPRQPDSEILKKIDKVAQYLYTHGEQKYADMAKMLDVGSMKMRTLLTYRYPVYESDDGITVGILDSKGNPVYTDKNKLLIYNDRDNLKFRSIHEAARFFDVSYHTVKRLIDGSRSCKLKGYKARWENG